jgi:hypothetical protein
MVMYFGWFTESGKITYCRVDLESTKQKRENGDIDDRVGFQRNTFVTRAQVRNEEAAQPLASVSRYSSHFIAKKEGRRVKQKRRKRKAKSKEA